MRRATLVAVALVTVLSATACAPQLDPVTAAAPASPLPPANIQATMVIKAQQTPIGQVLIDTNGHTLYRFDKDTAKPPKSNCGEDCYPKWPPLIHSSDLRVEGVDPALVGTIQRVEDQTRQVTIAGWPVYRYGGDLAPGETKGHGVGNVWFAITPQGKKAAGAPANNNTGAPANNTGNTGAGTGATNP